MDARRDWGHAEDYVRAMWLMLNRRSPEDFVISFGKQYSVRDFAKLAFKFVDLDYKKLNRMIVIEFGDKLSEKIDEINSIISNLKKEDLLIIEGWCDSHGRAKSRDIKVITGLANSFENKMAIISDSYQDASGQKRGFQGFMARGGRIIEESFRTIWTSRIDNQYQKILSFYKTNSNKQKSAD